MPDPPLRRPRAGLWRPSPGRLAALGVAAFVSVASVSVLVPVPVGRGERLASALLPPGIAERAARAEAAMRRGRELLRRAKESELGPAVGTDPSGLIGEELTPLVTTLGSLEAKRTSTNPAWGRVLTERLAAAGIGPGSLVAASLSGSFPGLNLALAAACQALDARLVAISSVTASSWGANQPGFTWPEIESRLVENGVIRRVSVAVTAGGSADRADDLPEEDRRVAERIRDRAAERLGVPALHPPGFAEAVAERVRIYRRSAGGSPIELYVNVGGADASLGRSPAVLGFGSGFVRGRRLPATPGRGVIAWFAEQGVPVLMLLDVRNLALRWGVGL